MSQTSYYDSIFGDLKGSQRYFDWVNERIDGSKTIIEMACGTGDLLSLLSLKHTVYGFDLDKKRIEKAQEKYPDLSTHFYVDNFLEPKKVDRYDLLICINDSLNYILDHKDLEKFVDASCQFADEMFLDSHHPYRLEEFSEPYLEEGSNEEFDYAYQITSDEDFLIHIVNFLDGTFDSIFQWVFDPQLLVNLYEAKGYSVDLYTDFDQMAVSKQGEKIMYHVYKEEKS